jgi:hypothetical protein
MLHFQVNAVGRDSTPTQRNGMQTYTNISTSVVCAMWCGRNAICQSFTYSSTSKICQLANVPLSLANATAITADAMVEWFDRIE